MESKKLIAVFCMVLIIGLPFGSLSVAAQDPINPRKSLGDALNPFVDEVDVGEAVIVNVDGYEPITISSDYLQNQDFPVYVFLKGMTAFWLVEVPEGTDAEKPSASTKIVSSPLLLWIFLALILPINIINSDVALFSL